MDIKKKVRVDTYTQSQKTFTINSELKATAATENLFIKEDSIKALDKVNLIVKDKSPAKEKSKTSD